MKIFQNILSEELYNKCIEEFSNKINSYSWQSSLFSWPESVTVGIKGSCLHSPVSDDNSLQIYQEVSSKINQKYQNYAISYCAWQPYSGLSLHNDAHHKVGATIYLNDTWDVNNGGIFLWKDKNSSSAVEIYQAICPTRNLMILNDNHEDHLVTPISSNCNELRSTIQIWLE